jgi:hypothetical protein
MKSGSIRLILTVNNAHTEILAYAYAILMQPEKSRGNQFSPRAKVWHGSSLRQVRRGGTIMYSRLLTIFGALVLSGNLFTGCAHVNHHVDGGNVPVSMTSHVGRDYDIVTDFHDSRKKVFFLWNLIPASTFNGGEIAEYHLAQNDGIANLSINTSYDVLDWLVTLFTAGLVSTMDIDVHGDLIRFKEPAVVITQPQTNINIR